MSSAVRTFFLTLEYNFTPFVLYRVHTREFVKHTTRYTINSNNNKIGKGTTFRHYYQMKSVCVEQITWKDVCLAKKKYLETEKKTTRNINISISFHKPNTIYLAFSIGEIIFKLEKKSSSFFKENVENIERKKEGIFVILRKISSSVWKEKVLQMIK